MLPAATDDIIYGGDGGRGADSSDSGSATPKWTYGVVVVLVVLGLGAIGLALAVVWRKRRARAFQRIRADPDDNEQARDRAFSSAYPPSTFVFVNSPARSATYDELRHLPTIPYATADEPASPGYSSTIPQGHSAGSALPSIDRPATVSLRAPDSPTPYRNTRRGAGLTLEPQSLVSAAEEAAQDGSSGLAQVPERAPSLPPPPYSPSVIGVGVCLSPRRAEG
ncbi:uncharacterized protein RHOBADRAFT_41353 [Rhodotorula graminis WP1]|uniref:Uncharacterized protein n=1 Tax=Rhodotorula graminis (strain WP1) TaxID=578459 RepID=A0A194SA70_RHOGW|nr:uncharacterized protein RHOBADRAFT_41353 [Rhodotorula graminis WP1]KPV77360.1 hypothetical protein RHOBADRAFT_41353 [Rhodotorula graminis WP1]